MHTHKHICATAFCWLEEFTTRFKVLAGGYTTGSNVETLLMSLLAAFPSTHPQRLTLLIKLDTFTHLSYILHSVFLVIQKVAHQTKEDVSGSNDGLYGRGAQTPGQETAKAGDEGLHCAEVVSSSNHGICQDNHWHVLKRSKIWAYPLTIVMNGIRCMCLCGWGGGGGGGRGVRACARAHVLMVVWRHCLWKSKPW